MQTSIILYFKNIGPREKMLSFLDITPEVAENIVNAMEKIIPNDLIFNNVVERNLRIIE